MGNTLIAPVHVAHTPLDWGRTLARAYDLHAAAVYGLAHRVTRDDDVATRLTAEVFAGLTDVTDEATLGACVLTDVHRRAVAWVRTAAAAVPSSPQEAALAALPSPEREVISAAYFDGLTYAEIARRLGLEVQEVMAHMNRGLHRVGVSLATPGH